MDKIYSSCFGFLICKNHEKKKLIQKIKELEISEKEYKNEIIKYKTIIQNLKYLDNLECVCNSKKKNNKKRRRKRNKQ